MRRRHNAQLKPRRHPGGSYGEAAAHLVRHCPHLRLPRLSPVQSSFAFVQIRVAITDRQAEPMTAPSSRAWRCQYRTHATHRTEAAVLVESPGVQIHPLHPVNLPFRSSGLLRYLPKAVVGRVESQRCGNGLRQALKFYGR